MHSLVVGNSHDDNLERVGNYSHSKRQKISHIDPSTVDASKNNESNIVINNNLGKHEPTKILKYLRTRNILDDLPTIMMDSKLFTAVTLIQDVDFQNILTKYLGSLLYNDIMSQYLPTGHSLRMNESIITLPVDSKLVRSVCQLSQFQFVDVQNTFPEVDNTIIRHYIPLILLNLSELHDIDILAGSLVTEDSRKVVFLKSLSKYLVQFQSDVSMKSII